METRFQFLAQSSLWAILPEAFYALLLRHPVAGGWECAKPSTAGKAGNKVAFIPIQGALSKDGPSYYGSNYDTITKAAEAAGADPDVKHVVLSVDSPGGNVQGLPETAGVLAELAKQKPVTAMVEGVCASAAYYLTSQARNIVLTPSGEVGSVGVRMMHADFSAALDKEGIKITELHAGDFKTEWSPYKPLSEEAVANMQPRLDAAHADFLNAVASGRGDRVSAEMAGSKIGGGRMFSATDALNHGLVDKLQATHDFYKGILPTQEEAATGPAYGFQRAQLEIARRRIS